MIPESVMRAAKYIASHPDHTEYEWNAMILSDFVLALQDFMNERVRDRGRRQDEIDRDDPGWP